MLGFWGMLYQLASSCICSSWIAIILAIPTIAFLDTYELTVVLASGGPQRHLDKVKANECCAHYEEVGASAV